MCISSLTWYTEKFKVWTHSGFWPLVYVKPRSNNSFRRYATQNSATALHLRPRTVATFTLLHHFIGYRRFVIVVTSDAGLHLSCNGTHRVADTPSGLPRHQLPRCLSALTSYGNRPNTTYVSSDSFAVHTTSRRRESWCGGLSSSLATNFARLAWRLKL